MSIQRISNPLLCGRFNWRGGSRGRRGCCRRGGRGCGEDGRTGRMRGCFARKRAQAAPLRTRQRRVRRSAPTRQGQLRERWALRQHMQRRGHSAPRQGQARSPAPLPHSRACLRRGRRTSLLRARTYTICPRDRCPRRSRWRRPSQSATTTICPLCRGRGRARNTARRG